MNCRQFEQYLDRYLDRELEGTLKLEFEAHLVECESCGHMYAMMEAVGQIVASPSPDEPQLSSDFTDRVMHSLTDRRQKTLRFRKFMAASSVAAAIGLILTGLVLFTSVQPLEETRFQPSPSQIVHAPLSADSTMLAMNDLPVKSSQVKSYFDLKNVFTPVAPSAAPLVTDTTTVEQKQAKEELNQWLASKLERAGNNLWEITQLRSVAWNQMRQGLFKSLSSPFSAGESFLPSDPSMPLIPARLEGLKDFPPLPQDEISMEAGVDLL